MTLDFGRCRLTPFQHQREDVAWLMNHPYAFVASEMRTGKSACIVIASQFLFEQNVIDNVIVVAPAPVRDVWADETLGEIAKHSFHGVPARITEFHARIKTWLHDIDVTTCTRALSWYVTNFEFIRSKNRLEQLMAAAGPRTWLVIDESSFVKGHNTLQTKACVQLRKRCGRVTLLNGTPLFHSPLDLFSQGNLIHKDILDCQYVTLFKARYALQTPVLERGKPMIRYGKVVKEVYGWTNLDDLERRFKPYTVRRLQKECLDLPDKLDPVTLTAVLGESWPHYKDMRDELVIWLNSSTVATSATAAIKALRLSQITGGFVGGAEDSGIAPAEEKLWNIGDFNEASISAQASSSDESYQQVVGGNTDNQQVGGITRQQRGASIVRASEERGDSTTQEGSVEVGREKLDILLWFISRELDRDPDAKIVAWSRFRAEILRAEREVKIKFPQMQTAVILGGQKKPERLEALALLKPETAPAGPVFVAGIEGTGSFGLDMSASHICVTMSGGYSPGRTAQTLDRVYGPGQRHPISYYNIVAVGPKGQKTIDHDILVARMNGENVARRTSAAWVKALKQE